MITGDQIRAARKRAGLSQGQLAKLVGVSGRTVGNWERGESAPGIAEERLIDVLSDHLAAGRPGRSLTQASDAELLAEIAKRFARTTEQQEEGDGDDRDAASMNERIEPKIADVLAARQRREEMQQLQQKAARRDHPPRG